MHDERETPKYAQIDAMQIGIVLALLSAALFGASTPLAKMMLGGVDPWMMAGLLYLGAGIGLATVRLGRNALHLPAIEAPLRRSDVPWLIGVIASGGILGPVFLMFGLARTDAAGTSLLLNIEGLATMGIAWLVFRENVDRRLLLGAFAILTGAALLSWQGRASLDWGAVLIVAACISWGRQQSDTQAFFRRPGANRDAQGPGRGNRKSDAGLDAGRCGARHRHHPCGCGGRFPWIRGQPCIVRARPSTPRDSADGGVFLIGSVHRRTALPDAP
jgi:uncharacterized membrane protein